MIEVLQPGAYTSVQGERAWRRAHFGIPLGGPADEVSHAAANRLVGNPAGARALEVTLLGPTLLFHDAARVVLCGAPFEANIPLGRMVDVAAGVTVVIRGTALGARCYLALAGGVLLTDGRVLRKGDRFGLGVGWGDGVGVGLGAGVGLGSGVALGAGDAASASVAASARSAASESAAEGVSVAEGADVPAGVDVVEGVGGPAGVSVAKGVSVAAGASIVGGVGPGPTRGDTLVPTPGGVPFVEGPVVLRYTSAEPRADLVYEVTSDFNRRGIRLAGAALEMKHEIITEGVNAGTIQVPPNGQPLILFYDQTTTGGYPKLGTIVRRDLARVGQLRPRDRVVLRRVSFEKAASE